MTKPHHEKAPHLETKRLILRPLTLNDAPWIQDKFNDWDIIKYMNINVPYPYPSDGAETFLKTIALPQIENNQAYHWAITLKNLDEGIGIISFRHNIEEHDGHRGFWIGKQYQRKGYVTEAIIAVNDFVFNVLKFDTFIVENAVENIASRRVKEKTGARLIGTHKRPFNCGEMDAEIWEVTKEEWIKRTEKND